MNTYLITSKNFEEALETADKIAKQSGVNQFDKTYLEFEKDLGIEDIRNIQKTIFLAPGKGNSKALIITLRKQATVEAQNSMLKLLEEPPANTLIFIISKTKGFFLPTVLSRVKVMELIEEADFEKEYEKVIKLSGIGAKLAFAQEISKDKDSAITFIEKAILSAREEMINSENPETALKLRKLIHSLELAHYDLINTNVSPRISIEHALLNLP